MNIKLISVTPDAEKQVAYCARVSNPKNQDNDNISKLLKYCIDHKHWSIFEMAYMTIEINTTRGLAAQILRHRSFTFQEFSQRYADTNLQNSIDDIDTEIIYRWNSKLREHFSKAKAIYDGMIKDGIAKECARFVLPLATPTRLYMSGSIRSWIHYIQLRSSHGTQKEHMNIANDCKSIFIEQFPIIGEALGWKNETL